ncbi:hypothetical protein [Arhodomonas sp. AD133]|uniref:hypothetical protein n=1 Tax=Arhodomonas sp. AD133 TaxID=3415009 RepID=UPI003EB7EB01
MDLTEVSQAQLNDIARLLNQRLRKTFGWHASEEAMVQELNRFIKKTLHLIFKL